MNVDLSENILSFLRIGNTLMPLSFEDYISPHEAAERLWSLSTELEIHNLDPDCVEELRLISQRFTRHLNGLEAFTYRLEDVARALRC